MKSLFQIYEIVITCLNFLEFTKATQLKYALNTNMFYRYYFFRCRVLNGAVFKAEVERSFSKWKWSGLFKRLISGAVF